MLYLLKSVDDNSNLNTYQRCDASEANMSGTRVDAVCLALAGWNGNAEVQVFCLPHKFNLFFCFGGQTQIQ